MTAFEEPGPSDAKPSREQEAKEHFLRGVALSREQSWEAALAEFLVSRELHPTRVALTNAAVCLKKLNRYAESYALYREALSDANVAATERASIEVALAELRANLGELDVGSEPSGAAVAVDGSPQGTTPLPKPVLVNAGIHSVRVAKQGYETFESRIAVAGGQRRRVSAKLKLLSRTGTLVVSEAEGRSVTVFIDGAAMGPAPFQGALAPGVHSVVLRGEGDLGTAPSAATVRDGETVTLVLRAERLDAELRIVPTPSNARVFLDGVAVGSGVWQGRLKSGVHRIEVSAEGHLPDRRVATVPPGRGSVLSVELERDLSSPMWRAGFSPHLYLELVGGIAWSPGFGGDADGACDGSVDTPEGRLPGCSDHSTPLGFLLGARAGYELTRGFGLEVFAGYLRLAAEQTRTVAASGEPQVGSLHSGDYRDTTSVAAPLAGLSASYRLLEKTPLTLRVWAGVARATVLAKNRGTFSGTYVDSAGNDGPIRTTVALPELANNIWMPVFGPEARFGFRLSKHFSVDVGLLALWAFPAETPRTADNVLGRSRAGRRTGRLPEVTLSDGTTVPAGTITLPEEEALGGAIFALCPSLGVRVDF